MEISMKLLWNLTHSVLHWFSKSTDFDIDILSWNLKLLYNINFHVKYKDTKCFFIVNNWLAWLKSKQWIKIPSKFFFCITLELFFKPQHFMNMHQFLYRQKLQNIYPLLPLVAALIIVNGKRVIQYSFV